jgi:hypothetical protein
MMKTIIRTIMFAAVDRRIDLKLSQAIKETKQ